MDILYLLIEIFKYIISTALILILPGLTLSLLFIKKHDFDIIEQIILSISLSMTMIPIIVLFYTLVGIKLTRTSTILTVLFFSIIFMCIIFMKYKYLLKISSASIYSKQYLGYLPLLLLFIFALSIRLIPIQGFIVPPGHDPQFHSIISQLIIEQGGIPSSYEPYAPLNSFSYPFGLHSIIVFFHFLTNEGIARLVLILSTVFNTMILLSVYLLVKKISSSDSNAIFSALLVGLVGMFPAGIIIHGKNSHITALVVLPVAILLLYYVFKTNKNSYMLLASISSAGLLLIHYRVFAFYLLFWVSLLLCQFIRVLKKQEMDRNSLVKIFLTPMIGLMIVSPWVLHILHKMLSITSDTLAPQHSGLISIISFSSFIKIINSILNTNGLYLCIFAVLGLGVVLVRKKEEMYPFILWLVAFLLFLTTIPLSFHIPGSNFINGGSIRITLFLPLTILAGYAISLFVSSNKKREVNIGTRRITLNLKILALIIIFTITLISATHVYSNYSSSKNNVLVSGDDLEAMEWIKYNTPSDSTFWSQAYYWKGVNVVLGSDAGYWIPVLTNRPNAVPLIPHTLEDNPLEYFEKSIKLIDLITTVPYDNKTLSILNELDIDYIYIGKRVFGGPSIDSELLLEVSNYELVYKDDYTSIFKVNYSAINNIKKNINILDLNLNSKNVFKGPTTTVLRINNISRNTLFEHPSLNGKSYVWYENIRLFQNSSLRFSIAMHPEVWKQNMGDGVLFEIFINQDLIFSKYIDPKNNVSDRKWQEFELPLDKYAGKNVTICFITSPGPKNDNSYDWAYWGEPKIIVKMPNNNSAS